MMLTVVFDLAVALWTLCLIAAVVLSGLVFARNWPPLGWGWRIARLLFSAAISWAIVAVVVLLTATLLGAPL